MYVAYSFVAMYYIIEIVTLYFSTFLTKMFYIHIRNSSDFIQSLYHPDGTKY